MRVQIEKPHLSLAAPLFGPKVFPYLHLQAAYFSIWAYLAVIAPAHYMYRVNKWRSPNFSNATKAELLNWFLFQI